MMALAACLAAACAVLATGTLPDRAQDATACMASLATADGASRRTVLAALGKAVASSRGAAKAVRHGSGGAPVPGAGGGAGGPSLPAGQESSFEWPDPTLGEPRAGGGGAVRPKAASAHQMHGASLAGASGSLGAPRSSSGVGTPGSASAAGGAGSPLAIYVRSLSAWLRGTLWQEPFAAAAVLVGVLLALDGPAIWRTLFTAVAAAAAIAAARYEAASWGLGDGAAPTLAAVVVGAAVALAVHVGFEGCQVVFGAALGLTGAYGFGDWARALDCSVPGLALAWYEAGAVGGFLVYTLLRKPALAMLTPLMGGFLVTAGAGVLASRTCAALAMQAPSLLPPPDAPLTAAAAALLGRAGIGALPIHCGVALLAALLHGCTRRRWLALGCLLSSVALAGVAAGAGLLGCAASPVVLEGCPPWMEPVDDWQWPTCGALLWLALAAASAWRQLELLQDWESGECWRGGLSAAYAAVAAGDGGWCPADARRVVPEAQALEGGSGEAAAEPPRHRDPDFMTRMPSGFDPDDLDQDPFQPKVASWADGRLDGLLRWVGQMTSLPRGGAA